MLAVEKVEVNVLDHQHAFIEEEPTVTLFVDQDIEEGAPGDRAPLRNDVIR